MQGVAGAGGRLAQLAAHALVLDEVDEAFAQQRHFAQLQQRLFRLRLQRVLRRYVAQLILEDLQDALGLAGELVRRVLRVLHVERRRGHDQEVGTVVATVAVAFPIVGGDVAGHVLHFQLGFG